MAKRGNGEGSITRRGDKWLAQITVCVDEKSCKTVRKAKVTTTRKEAVDFINQMIALKKKGELCRTNKVTIAEWLTTWLNDYKKLNIKQTTYDSYENSIKIHLTPGLGKIQLQKLTVGHVQSFINNMVRKNLSPKTVIYNVSVLSSSLKQAVKNNLIPKNPCEQVELPKRERKEIVTLGIDQLLKFKESIKDYYLYPALLLQLTTGIRRGEVLGLTWDNVHMDEGYISIKQHLIVTRSGLHIDTPKTINSVRDIPLADEVIEVLRAYREARTSGLVFSTASGKPISPRNYQRSFDKLLRYAGIPKIRIHDMRHTFATMMLANGVDIKTVSELIGHSDVRFTANCYTHPTMEMKRHAMDKMNDILATATI